VKNPDRLDGVRALACGASAGIGRAIAEELARRGARVTVLARRRAALEEVRARLEEISRESGGAGGHLVLPADMDRPEEAAAAVRAHLAENGPHLVLVLNSGGPPAGPIVEAEPADFEAAFRRLLLAGHLLVRELLPGMRDAGWGRIVNVVSLSVRAPIPGLGVSNTARWAVAAWAKTLAGEVARDGITVNCVLPGYTDTERLAGLFEKMAAERGTDPETVARETAERIPAGRLGRPEEVAALAGFLASPAASYVTGTAIPADGGASPAP